MMKLPAVIQKNLKVLFRSKFTSLMVLFGPLIVILLISYAFSNFSTYRIQVGTYSDQYSDLAQRYIVELSGSDFKVVKYSSESECIQEIKYGGIHTCLIFPPDFDVLNSNNVLKFYVDPSNVNLVWMVTDEVSRKIELSSSKVSINITQDIMGRVEQTQAKSKEIISSLDNITSIAERSSVLTNSVDTDLASLKYEASMPKASEIDIASIDSATTSLYSSAKSASLKVDELISSIKSSSTWSAMNSSQRSSLDSLMTSAQTSAVTLRTSMSSKYNSTTAKISNITLKIFEFDQSLSKIQTELDLSKNTKTVLSQKVASIRYDLSIILMRLSAVKALVQSSMDTLSGIAVKDARNIVNPVSTQIVPITNDGEKHVNFLFPALLILIIMFISLLLSSLNIVLEKNSRAYFRNFVTPTNDAVFLVSSYITNILVLLAQLVIVFGVTYFALDKQILANFGPTCLILFMTATFFVFLGMIIGYMFSSEEGAILGTISISSVFFFVSNLVIPIDALPETVKFFVNLNPFVIASSLLKRSFLFHVPIEILKPDLILFAMYIVVSLLILFVIQRITKLKFFYHNVQKNKKVEVAIETKGTKPIRK